MYFGPHWGACSACPNLLAGLTGSTSKGSEIQGGNVELHRLLLSNLTTDHLWGLGYDQWPWPNHSMWAENERDTISAHSSTVLLFAPLTLRLYALDWINK